MLEPATDSPLPDPGRSSAETAYLIVHHQDELAQLKVRLSAGRFLIFLFLMLGIVAIARGSTLAEFVTGAVLLSVAPLPWLGVRHVKARLIESERTLRALEESHLGE